MGEDRKVTGTWLKVFCPEARCLSEEEIMQLPREKREHSGIAGKSGLWLEVFCPDESCLREEEKMHLPVIRPEPGKKDYWLRFFCPEDRCVVDEGSDLP